MIIRRKQLLGLWAFFAVFLILWIFWYWASPPASPISDRSVSQAPQSWSCDFVSRFGFDVDCYWVQVGAVGARAKLAVAVFRGADKAYADPLVYIAGGPGEADNTGEESLAAWDLWLAETAIARDFVLIDLRGLAPSVPAWDCQEYTDKSRELLNRNLTFAEEGEIIAPVLVECLNDWQVELAQRGGPVGELRDFTSGLNAADLGESLRHLGYQQWNYLAVSYGTRVALLAAMQQPEVRRVILDSPYALERGSISDSVLLWVEAFARYWRWCSEASCEFSEEQFWQLMADLRQTPEWVEVENWRTGRTEKWVLNDGRLAAALYTAFYSSELTGMIAPALDRYSRGDISELTQILEIFFNQALDSRFNSAIYWAIECNDNPFEDEATFQRALATAGPWRDYFSSDWQYSVCRSAPFGPGQLPPMELISSPVLVAVGELDPITTEVHARELMSWLTTGHLLVQQGKSHAEFFMGACGQELIPWFLQATPEQLASERAERSESCQSLRGESGVK